MKLSMDIADKPPPNSQVELGVARWIQEHQGGLTYSRLVRLSVLPTVPWLYQGTKIYSKGAEEEMGSLHSGKQCSPEFL